MWRTEASAAGCLRVSPDDGFSHADYLHLGSNMGRALRHIYKCTQEQTQKGGGFTASTG